MTALIHAVQDVDVANGLEKKVDRLGTLLEEVVGHVRVLAEGHGAVVDRLERLEIKVDGIGERLDGHDIRLKRIEHHLALNGAAPPKPRRATKRQKSKK